MQVPHVAVDISPDVLHLRAQILVGSIRTQYPDPTKKERIAMLLTLSQYGLGLLSTGD